ncbi:MAG: DUF1566 domain-containing protein [Campylobacterota bacterium]|nr:DUF1566 domain-containing protein [Campylobacterota bacterium]
MRKIVLGILVAVSLFASVESEVEAERFKRSGGVLTDSFAGMQWQDNSDAKTIKKDWQGAKDYCANLTLGGKSDWRLPNRDELRYAYKIKNKFNNPTSSRYWSSSPVVSNGSGAWGVYFKYGDSYYDYKTGKYYVRCARAGQYDTLTLLEKKVNSYRRLEINKKYKVIYPKVKKQNNISGYEWFIKTHPKAPQVKEAQQNIYKLAYLPTKQQNNISGYEWFIKTYPKAPQVKEAIKNIHKLAYNKAKDINTISAYNTFIYSYPFASQVRDANDRAYDLESLKYKKLKKDDEKKARLLAVRIKKLTVSMKRKNNKDGYIIVKDRMIKLLTEQYEETDASLRYYESKEFTDFTNTFENVMSSISSKLSSIERYSSEILNTSKQGFKDSKADREMSRYKDEQHRQWEKRMRVRDKGNM